MARSVRVHAPITPRLVDADAERVRRAHEEAIVEMQAAPAIGLRVLSDISLVDSKRTPVAHGLGKIPTLVIVSPPRNATSTGRLIEVRDSAFDRTQYVILEAIGFGATVIVDVGVM